MIEFLYLGIHFLCGKTINIDVTCTIQKFCAAASALFSHTKNVSEPVKLSLFETFTLPIICYGIDVLVLQ